MDPARRAKVFYCDSENTWEDRGTGHVYFGVDKSTRKYYFQVKSETDYSTLLESEVSTEDIYDRQQASLVVWADPVSGEELALSFQDTAGCDWMLDVIAKIREGHLIEEDSQAHQNVQESVTVTLPSVQICNLGEISRILHDAITRFTAPTRKGLAYVILNDKEQPCYLKKLLDLFDECEHNQDMEALHNLYNITKNIVLLNDGNIFDFIFRDENIMKVFGALEFDPEFPNVHMQHRKFLSTSSIFKEVVPICDAEVENKIHQTYRLQYLKEVALARVLDDSTFASLKTLVLINNVEIVQALQHNAVFLRGLFDGLLHPSVDQSEKRTHSLLLLLHELCTLAAKNLESKDKAGFFKDLVDGYHLFEVFRMYIAPPNLENCAISANLLSTLLANDPAPVRDWIFRQRDTDSLLQQMAEIIMKDDLADTYDDMQSLYTTLFDILRFFLDPTTMEVTAKEHALGMVYPHILEQLMLALDNTDTGGVSEAIASRSILLCDLFSFCVQYHGLRMRTFLLRHGLMRVVMKTLSFRESHVALAGIRFFRVVLKSTDEFYNRHIIQFKLFDPVVDVLKRNGNRYNLLNSAIIDIFEYINQQVKTGKKKKLLLHIVPRYREYFSTIKYVPTFSQLLELYDHPGHAEFELQQFAGCRAVDEDAYFNEESDEETAADEAASSEISVALLSSPERRTLEMVAENGEDGIYNVMPLGDTSKVSTTRGHGPDAAEEPEEEPVSLWRQEAEREEEAHAHVEPAIVFELPASAPEDAPEERMRSMEGSDALDGDDDEHEQHRAHGVHGEALSVEDSFHEQAAFADQVLAGDADLVLPAVEKRKRSEEEEESHDADLTGSVVPPCSKRARVGDD